MYKFCLIVIVGFLAIQNIECRSPPKPQSGEIEQTVVEKTKEVIKSTNEALNGHLPDTKQVISKVEETGHDLINHIKDFNDAIKKTLKNNEGQIDDTLKQVSEKLVEARESLEKKILGTNGQKKAQEIRESISKSLQDAATQIGKLGDSIKPEAERVKTELFTEAKKFLENAEKVTSNLKNAVTDSNTKQ